MPKGRHWEYQPRDPGGEGGGRWVKAAGRVGGRKKDEPKELRSDRIAMYKKMRGAGADRKRAYDSTAPLDKQWAGVIKGRLQNVPGVKNIRLIHDRQGRYEVTYERDGLAHVFRTRGVSRALGPAERPLPRDWGQHRR